MKHISYYLTKNKTVQKLSKDNEIVQKWETELWDEYDAIKIEVWPVDFKISPCKKLPQNGKRKQLPQPVEQPKNPTYEKRPSQKTLFRRYSES